MATSRKREFVSSVEAPVLNTSEGKSKTNEATSDRFSNTSKKLIAAFEKSWGKPIKSQEDLVAYHAFKSADRKKKRNAAVAEREAAEKEHMAKRAAEQAEANKLFDATIDAQIAEKSEKEAAVSAAEAEVAASKNVAANEKATADLKEMIAQTTEAAELAAAEKEKYESLSPIDKLATKIGLGTFVDGDCPSFGGLPSINLPKLNLALHLKKFVDGAKSLFAKVVALGDNDVLGGLLNCAKLLIKNTTKTLSQLNTIIVTAGNGEMLAGFIERVDGDGTFRKYSSNPEGDIRATVFGSKPKTGSRDNSLLKLGDVCKSLFKNTSELISNPELAASNNARKVGVSDLSKVRELFGKPEQKQVGRHASDVTVSMAMSDNISYGGGMVMASSSPTVVSADTTGYDVSTSGYSRQSVMSNDGSVNSGIVAMSSAAPPTGNRPKDVPSKLELKYMSEFLEVDEVELSMAASSASVPAPNNQKGGDSILINDIATETGAMPSNIALSIHSTNNAVVRTRAKKANVLLDKINSGTVTSVDVVEPPLNDSNVVASLTSTIGGGVVGGGAAMIGSGTTTDNNGVLGGTSIVDGSGTGGTSGTGGDGTVGGGTGGDGTVGGGTGGDGTVGSSPIGGLLAGGDDTTGSSIKKKVVIPLSARETWSNTVREQNTSRDGEYFAVSYSNIYGKYA